MTISCLIRCDLMFSLALHFHSLRSRSPYLPGNVSPDCLGNSALPACNESGQRLEQLNRRDNQSLIQTAMQNIQAIPSENVLSGILDFKLHLINLKRARRKSLMDSDRLKRNMWSPKPVSFPGEKRRRKKGGGGCQTYTVATFTHVKGELCVMGDFISCTCQSLPSWALRKCANSPCWSRSVNSLMPADVCRVFVRKHHHVRSLPKHASYRGLIQSLKSELLLISERKCKLFWQCGWKAALYSKCFGVFFWTLSENFKQQQMVKMFLQIWIERVFFHFISHNSHSFTRCHTNAVLPLHVQV